MLPVAKKYGAAFILLPLGDDDIPEKFPERCKFAEKIYKTAEKQGFVKSDILIDGLVMTISSNQSSAIETLKMVEWASENGFNSVLGLSNVSFGLPERRWVNAAFLAMAASRGLTCAIANPESVELMNAKFATDALLSRDKSCVNYVKKFQDITKVHYQQNTTTKSPIEKIYEAVVKGDKEHISEILKNSLDQNIAPTKIVDEALIPAINHVGVLFDKKEYYLPQLIMSAETMKAGFDFLEPMLKKENKPSEKNRKVILATVKGDIHDIGKNIVGLMLENYGFEVIDLGKDVGHEKIIEAISQTKAQIVGLSALMTTTMVNMKTIIEACKNAGLDNVKFMIGGAVVDQAYADEIGANGYAPDSVEAVKLAERLLP